MRRCAGRELTTLLLLGLSSCMVYPTLPIYKDSKELIRHRNAGTVSKPWSVEQWIAYASKSKGVSASLIRKVLWHESRFDQYALNINRVNGVAVSKDEGIGQINSLYCPKEVNPYSLSSIVYVASVLKHNLLVFEGNVRLAVTAYNHGITGTIRDGEDPVYLAKVGI